MLNTDLPQITVITPHYQSRTLFSSIDSVLEQSYPEIQYIIVVDGQKGFSADEIEEYLREHSPDKVTWNVIGLAQNMGTVYALNCALPLVSGEFVFNLADDDVFTHPDVLFVWTEHMRKNQSMISTAKRQVLSTGSSDKITIEPTQAQINSILSKTPEELFEDLAVSNYVMGSCTAQSRECIMKFGKYDPQYRLIEDYPRVMKLLRCGVRLDFFSEEVVRCGSEGISSPGRILNLLEENEMIFRNEILPYCANPRKASIRYWFWKLKRIRQNKFLVQTAQADTWKKKTVLFLLYPENLIRMIKKYSRRKNHNAIQTTDQRR